MARQRRGGFRPPELRGTLGTLLRTTLEQAGVVRDAIERGARARLGDARAHRRRKDALADLGELVLDLIRRGEIDLGELPEAHDLIRQLDDLDAEGADEPDDRIAQPPLRRRFDARPDPRSVADRGRDPDRDRARPRARDDDFPDDDRDGGGHNASGRGGGRGVDDDGTVSAIRGPRPNLSSRSDRSGPDPRATRGSSSLKPAVPPRVWRPSLVDDEPAPPSRESRDARDSRDPSDPRSLRDARPATSLPRDPHRKGGIQFDDEDLADYMHPDDVPPKPPSDDDR